MNNKLNEIKAAVSNLEETSEGLIRGGFSPVGGSTASPLGTNNGCTNNGCINNECNLGCPGTNDNNGCTNNTCKPTSPVTGKSQSSIGMTFVI